ncbi:hypothetical protein F7230_04615 [Corynebacterium sp. 320]|uniref:hypothetical protein n=1 Tax=Corynebacterium TaxID=1716 RepID=UPI00125CBFF5|nr:MULTISPECIES: hypothetical protein [Corynebacterium]KAB1504365.1 hypothetical protein F7230_04615 [Corynebacterium sp. 320]KAB1552537.1 hypothetical protein F7233_01985 [Corynebacterium sp. 321]KAB3528501.1 hypothetical protein F8354_04615 [Corynebacterium sp. 250]QNP92042.1 hypothetical protein IAU67_08480 [Corynebacterium zhongnanshanii]
MAITFEEAVRIAQEKAAPLELMDDFVEHGEGKYCFYMKVAPIPFGESGVLIVYEADGSVTRGSGAPGLCPHECEILDLEGNVTRTLEQVRKAREAYEAGQAALEADIDDDDGDGLELVPAKL